jgi:hypothetical protein
VGNSVFLGQLMFRELLLQCNLHIAIDYMATRSVLKVHLQGAFIHLCRSTPAASPSVSSSCSSLNCSALTHTSVWTAMLLHLTL